MLAYKVKTRYEDEYYSSLEKAFDRIMELFEYPEELREDLHTMMIKSMLMFEKWGDIKEIYIDTEDEK